MVFPGIRIHLDQLMVPYFWSTAHTITLTLQEKITPLELELSSPILLWGPGQKLRIPSFLTVCLLKIQESILIKVEIPIFSFPMLFTFLEMYGHPMTDNAPLLNGTV